MNVEIHKSSVMYIVLSYLPKPKRTSLQILNKKFYNRFVPVVVDTFYLNNKKVFFQ